MLGELSLNPIGKDDVKDILDLIECMESHSIELTCNEAEFSMSSDSIQEYRSNHSNKKSSVSIRQEFESHAVKTIVDEIFDNPYSEYKGFTIRCGNSAKSPSENVIVGFVFIRYYRFNRFLIYYDTLLIFIVVSVYLDILTSFLI